MNELFKHVCSYKIDTLRWKGRKCLTSNHFWWVEIGHVCNRNSSGTYAVATTNTVQMQEEFYVYFSSLSQWMEKMSIYKHILCCWDDSLFRAMSFYISLHPNLEFQLTHFQAQRKRLRLLDNLTVYRHIWQKQLTQTSKFNYIMLTSRFQKDR